MNKVILVGRLTKDPEMYAGSSEKSLVAKFNLAVERKYYKNEEISADFVPCISFGKTAAFIEKYFTKGMKANVVGRIQTGSYTNKEGNKIFTVNVVVEDIEFAESKKKGTSEENQTVDEAGFMEIPEGDEDLPFNLEGKNI